MEPDAATADADDALHLTRLTLDRFKAVALVWRKQAQCGDRTTRLVADALESVVRRRIALALARQQRQLAARKPVPTLRRAIVQSNWWPL
jgi:hypothetical protein